MEVRSYIVPLLNGKAAIKVWLNGIDINGSCYWVPRTSFRILAHLPICY